MATIGCGGDAPLHFSVPSQPTTPRVTVSIGVASLALGQQVQATAQVFDASGHALSDANVTWSSSESAIANVTPAGMVQAVAPGKAIVRAVAKSAAGIDSIVILTPPPPSSRRCSSRSPIRR
ncbi:MAG: Ig-like domain-containing protein [Gemmatimonadetes bacterium]|nr:Ig-like domain-containing protein [Gemmatimonadota bacterium]